MSTKSWSITRKVGAHNLLPCTMTHRRGTMAVMSQECILKMVVEEIEVKAGRQVGSRSPQVVCHLVPLLHLLRISQLTMDFLSSTSTWYKTRATRPWSTALLAIRQAHHLSPSHIWMFTSRLSSLIIVSRTSNRSKRSFRMLLQRLAEAPIQPQLISTRNIVASSQSQQAHQLT